MSYLIDEHRSDFAAAVAAVVLAAVCAPTGPGRS